MKKSNVVILMLWVVFTFVGCSLTNENDANETINVEIQKGPNGSPVNPDPPL